MTHTMQLNNLKSSDMWYELCYNLLYEDFKAEHPEIGDEKACDLFYDQVISKKFKYGEYANIEIQIDENFNIIGGRIIPYKE